MDRTLQPDQLRRQPSTKEESGERSTEIRGKQAIPEAVARLQPLDSVASSGILSPQPQLKQQLLESSSFSYRGAAGIESEAECDMEGSQAERGHLKDIVLKFHRHRCRLTTPQEEDDLGSLPAMLSTTTPYRNRAPSPYPYAREELTTSPTLRSGQAPKVCLSPYKRFGNDQPQPGGTQARKTLFNSEEPLSTAATLSRDRALPSHNLGLGLLPSPSPPLPMQREIVDKVKVALDEAMQSVKSKIIEDQLLTWAQSAPRLARRHSYHPSHDLPLLHPPEPNSHGHDDKSLTREDLQFDMNDRHMLPTNTNEAEQLFPRISSTSPPPSQRE
jgi:hypothetical protein